MGRNKGLSYMQRTLKAQRAQGRKCEVVERRIPIYGQAFSKSQDLFNIIDIIALDPELGIVGVQACGNDFAPHVKKITIEHAQDTIDWLEAGGALELWGWRKVKVKRGGKAMVWKPRVRVFTMEDFA